MKCLLLSCLLLLNFPAFAEEDFPVGCQPIAVKDSTIMLKTNKPPALVLIHNITSTEHWVTYPVADASASAGWSSKLQGGNWSALNLQDESFELTCVESNPGHEQQVPCSGILSVCIWEGVKPPNGEAGTYWAGEDSTLSALKASVGGRGFVLPTPSHQ